MQYSLVDLSKDRTTDVEGNNQSRHSVDFRVE